MGESKRDEDHSVSRAIEREEGRETTKEDSIPIQRFRVV